MKDLEYVEVEVHITWDEKIKNIDHETVEQNIKTICENELKKNGLSIGPEGFNRLSFHFITTYLEGIVAVSYTMDLYEYIIPKKHLMQLLEDAVSYAQIGSELHKDGEEPVERNLHTLTLQNLLRMLSSEINYWWRPIWLSDLGVFMIGEKYLQSALEDQTRNLVNKFVDEYLSSNKNE